MPFSTLLALELGICGLLQLYAALNIISLIGLPYHLSLNRDKWIFIGAVVCR